MISTYVRSYSRLGGMGWAAIFFLMFGCVGSQIDSAINKHAQVANRINLGDSKNKVLTLLLPTQEGVPSNARKSREMYSADGKSIEIHYMRTGRQPDGLTTDDEFTPYIFTDNVLTAVGWQTLGGEKSHGQEVVQPAPVTNTNQTVIITE